MTDLSVIDGEKTYTVRTLDSSDVRKVGGMVGKLMGDPRVTNALASGDQTVILFHLGSVLLETASHDFVVWIASLVGEDENVESLKEYKRRESEKAREENRLPAPAHETKLKREEDIVALIDRYPVEFLPDVISEVMEQDGFENFLVSCYQLGTGFQKNSEKLQKRFKKTSGSKTKK